MRSGREEWPPFRQAFETRDGKWLVVRRSFFEPGDGGSDPVWSHSGHEIFFRGGQNEMMTVAIAPGASFSFGQPKALFSAAPSVSIGAVPSFDLSPYDQRFLMLRGTAPTERNELILVQNWIEEMKARAQK